MAWSQQDRAGNSWKRVVQRAAAIGRGEGARYWRILILSTDLTSSTSLDADAHRKTIQ